MSDLPSISIIVPNYNGGATIADTLQSLVDQKYPRLEIVVIDGGSRDNSVEIIKRFEPHLAYWVSEKDRGQSHAINKGFARCTGEVMNWLCSDDILLPGALAAVGRYFSQTPEVDAVVGRAKYMSMKTDELIESPRASLEMIGYTPACVAVRQASCFYKRSLIKRPFLVDESYNYVMDVELWAYFNSVGCRWKPVDEVLSFLWEGGDNKTSQGGEKIILELERMYRAYWPERVSLTFWHRLLRHPVEKLLIRHQGRFIKALMKPYQVLTVILLGPFYGFRRVRVINWQHFLWQAGEWREEALSGQRRTREQVLALVQK